MAQNGTASAVANPASPPAAGSAPVATPASVSAPPSASVASGTGSVGSNGACSCSCLCGAGSFGDLSTQGKSAFGGFGGMLSPPTGGS